ncbi:MAG: lipopolysaccharide heptosyltransferase II [Verrucomicrobiae bacterium]
MNSQSVIGHQPSAPRILIRGVNWLGDAVMTTPALLRLREKFPEAHITLLTHAKLADLWQHHPAINETIGFKAGESILAIAKKLRAGKFDLALVLPNSPRSALEVFLADIPQRIGYARGWRNLLLTRAFAPRSAAVKMRKRTAAEIHRLSSQILETGNLNQEIPKSAHQIFEYLNLTAALGANPEPLAPQLFVTPEEIEAAKKKFGLEKITAPIFGLNPGAEYGAAKRWPVEKFIAAAKEIQQRTNCVWILFGGKTDAAITNQIASQLPTSSSHLLNLAGKTNLRELMALLKLCRVVLTNDTGPMHVATALGTPVVVPFGSTSPELTGPGLPGDARNYLLKSDAPCSPCFLRECPIDFRCLKGISESQVISAVMEIVSPSPIQ